MTQKMRAKFTCQTNDGDENSKTAKLLTEYSASPEDQMFNEATPYGTIEIMIDKKGAMDFLKPGKSYYVDFTEVPELEKAGPDDIPENEGVLPSFKEELSTLLNIYCKENSSNTNDFILAEYLDDCLSAYDKAVSHRDSMKVDPT